MQNKLNWTDTSTLVWVVSSHNVYLSGMKTSSFVAFPTVNKRNWNKNKLQSVCRAVDILDKSNLPAEMSPEYGEAQVKLLCNKFGFSFSEIKTAFRTFKDTNGNVVPAVLKRLQNCIETIPVSTASCERGFSKMNIVSTALRTRLTVQHMSSLMFISINGPPLSMWQPLKYVKSWLALNHRNATCTQGPSKMTSSSIEEPSLQTLWKFKWLFVISCITLITYARSTHFHCISRLSDCRFKFCYYMTMSLPNWCLLSEWRMFIACKMTDTQ